MKSINFLETWQKVLSRSPGYDHYAISNPERSIAGSATLQRFPKVEVEGVPAVSILAHSHAYPLGRGGQYAGFTSMAWWFDARTGTLLSNCIYSDNKSRQAMHSGMGSWDWLVKNKEDRVSLGLPVNPITVDWTKSDVSYASGWAPYSPAMGNLGWGIGQGNAYSVGQRYSLSATEFSRRITVETVGQENILAYRWSLGIKKADVETVENLCFWIDVENNSIQRVECSVGVIEVDPSTFQHTWYQRETTWDRLNYSQVQS